jgi:hypothetical protein
MNRPNLQPYQVIPNANASPANSGSMASNIISAVSIIGQLTELSYAVSWTGTSPVGTISVQVSNDYQLANNGAVLNAGTWNTIPLEYSGSAVMSVPVSGNTGNGVIDIGSIGLYAIRLVYTATSGTGSLIATINGKVA